jgi:hypothetical protein
MCESSPTAGGPTPSAADLVGPGDQAGLGKGKHREALPGR